MIEMFVPSLLALDWMLAFLAAFVCLDLAKRLESKLDREGFGWLLGASLALATGLWSAQVIGIDRLDLPYAIEYRPVPAFGVWLGAGAACALGLAVACRRSAGLDRTLIGALLLAGGIVGIQVSFVEALGLQPGPAWLLPGLGIALIAAAAGCSAALWLYAEVRVRVKQGLLAWQAAAALILGIAIVVSQSLVMGAAGLNGVHVTTAMQDVLSEDAMGVLVKVGSAALLSMLLVMSQLEAHLRASLQRAKGELRKQSFRDPLTELPNRQIFEGTLAQAAHQADTSQGGLALLLVNLDGFKPINESLGHRVGDRVLREIAARLRSLAQAHMVARLGGDEFLLLMPDNPTTEQAADLAARVLGSLSLPCRIEGRETAVTASIGIVMYPEHGAVSTLIAHADAAMRFAKSSGGATYCFFEARMVSGLREQTELLRDLRRALAQGELELFYQPKIHAPTGEITGAEALMRWQHPRLGMISPVVFIPIAERFGLIGSLGNWLIDEVCRQIRVWRDGGLRMRVAINLSVHQLRQPDLVERIARALGEHDVNPGLLTCEITESVAMEDAEGTIRFFGQLAQLGVSISIDDFGTGHSSLAYLRKLPASELKIDRSFVLDLETSEDARKVASAVINLAKSLDLKVVAEGVETEGQNRILREFGCDQLQGYLFAKPMSAKALALWAMDDVGPRSMTFRSSLFKETQPAELA
ncbi:MAG: EAL domain-containing protein [Burkholderiaceae bacterium]|nr:EAL domain-containing protein [Burkholderiaceae bacterium]